MGKTTILGVPFDTYTMNEAADYAVNLLDKNGQHIICTPNPEIVMEAQQDRELMGILKAADMVTPDGVGVVWASKYTKSSISERVSGYDLVINIFERIKNTDYTVYFFGGAPGSPKQEKWIYNNLRLTGAKLAIGIGGSFDVMSGNLKRAPKIFCKLGLEWFYRLITQPSRFKRMLKLPQFVLKVRKEMR